jgi:hypothetical protein
MVERSGEIREVGSSSLSSPMRGVAQKEECSLWEREVACSSQATPTDQAMDETMPNSSSPIWPDDFRGFGTNVRPRRQR